MVRRLPKLSLADPPDKGNEPLGGTTDNSTTQFAVLAIWAARRHDVPMERTLHLISRRYQTSQNVTIKSMATTATVTKLSGPNWQISVGQTSGDDQVTFSPKSVSSGSKTTIKFTTGWTCTNPGTAPANTYADFSLVISLVTSAGTYKINLPGHRMKMA